MKTVVSTRIEASEPELSEIATLAQHIAATWRPLGSLGSLDGSFERLCPAAVAVWGSHISAHKNDSGIGAWMVELDWEGGDFQFYGAETPEDMVDDEAAPVYSEFKEEYNQIWAFLTVANAKEEFERQAQ